MTIKFIREKYRNGCKILRNNKKTLRNNESIILSDPETKQKQKYKAKVTIIALTKSYIITADGGIFPKNQGDKRADFIAYTNKNLYIIELKGKAGVESAYDQILSTIKTILHSDDFGFLIKNRDKTIACIAGQVRLGPRVRSNEKELARILKNHSKEKQKNILDLIIYSYKTEHKLYLDKLDK